jgi:DNA-binding Lrp family transcriptional regulator
MNKPLDELDRAILSHLQENARITNSELAQRVQLSPPGLQKRLRKLEDAGIINRYVTLVDREKVGIDLLCFIQVDLQYQDGDIAKAFVQAIQAMPEVLECYHVTGDSNYLLKVVVGNRRRLEHFLIDTLSPAPGVSKIHTAMVLNDVKMTTALPLDCEDQGAS